MAKAKITTKGFGGRLRAARLERGLTQEQLEDRVSRPRTWVSQMENGHRLPSLPNFAALVDELGVSADDLLTR